ncbi:MAG: hypothetical protein KC421_14285 [Anaerolineales bacterium]|nr:hypothetical protein [Anaerolineales bacterium]
MSSNLSPIWQKRWNALEKTMQATDIGTTSETLSSMLTCLAAFGKSQFQFFYDGFNSGKLLPSMHHPAEFVLNATLSQVSYDLSVIRQAADQRRSPHLKDTLEKADQLAQSALNLAVTDKLLKPGTVVTYFNKSAHIRVIPYAPVALVGIPYTAIETPRDLLAIPHEVGHYVYHHATGLAAKLHTQIPFDPPWFNHWIEEIFADIYGCLVAGPVIGLDFQDLLLDNPTEHFTEDDGEHPVDAIRPFIHTTVLNRLGFKNAAEALQDRWAVSERLRNYPESFIPFDSDYEVDLRIARTKLQEVVSHMLNYLQTEYNLTPNTYWTDDLPAGQNDAEAMYTAFENWIAGSLNIHVNTLQTNKNKTGVNTGIPPLQNTRKIGDTNTWRDSLKQLNQIENQILPWSAWMLIFTAGNWPIKGPEGDPVGV